MAPAAGGSNDAYRAGGGSRHDAGEDVAAAIIRRVGGADAGHAGAERMDPEASA